MKKNQISHGTESREDTNNHEPQPQSPSHSDFVDERWIEFKIIGKNILSRSNHVSVIYKDMLYIHGGYNTDKGVLGDLQVISLKGEGGFKWREVELKGDAATMPGRLRNHTGVVYQQSLVVFGGQNEKNKSNNLMWLYNFEANRWKRQQPEARIPALDSHSAVIEGENMYVFGGFVDQKAEYSGDLYMANLETMEWQCLTSKKTQSKSPTPRGNMSMVFHDNNLWIFGGRNLKSTFNDFWRFDLANGEWTQILSQNMPDPRRSHSMIVYGRLFWMFGGIQDVTKEKNDINIYSSSENLWTKIMNSSNLVYECSPTMKNKKGNSSIKAKLSIKRELSRNSHRINLINPLEDKRVSSVADGMKRILEENKHKKFMERKHELLKEFQHKPKTAKLKSLSPVSQSMLKTLDLIADQEPIKKVVLQGQIMYDPTNRLIIGKKPCARDGHSALPYNEKMIIFGGDRHLMCFSDLYYFDLKKGIESKTLYQRPSIQIHLKEHR